MDDLDVKVGDKVILQRYGDELVAVVTRVTPSGMFDAGRYRFKKNGVQLGDSMWGSLSARKGTEQDYARIEENNFRSKTILRMRDADFVRALSTDQLRRIAAILDEGVER